MKRYLDVIYPEHEKGPRPYDQLLIDYLIERYAIHPQSRLLDLGCGDGKHMTCFHNRDVDASGVDKPVIDLEKDEIYFKTGTFDFVFCKSLIEHVYNTPHLLAEAYRVLKPRGIAIFLTPDWGTDYKYFWDDPTHVKPFTKQGLADAFRLAGFVDVKCQGFYQLPVLWHHPWLKFIVYAIRVLPDALKWKSRERKEQRVWIRHSKERMLLLKARRPS